ncbi:MAG: hypothetical protein NT039_04840, partial [Candidatus Berkelbacteria bacterium]|nr:hypothetical protein [Candidatus Berkelbacteria bacterium]
MNEFTESSSEEIQNPEIPTGDWQTLIIIQRHGEYDNRRPADWQNLTSDEQKNLGRLTEKGKDKVTHISQERISAILEQNPEETDFILINSPTFWLDEPQFGQRARETAEIIGQTILASLGERGLNQNQLLNVRPKTSDHP